MQKYIYQVVRKIHTARDGDLVQVTGVYQTETEAQERIAELRRVINLQGVNMTYQVVILNEEQQLH